LQLKYNFNETILIMRQRANLLIIIRQKGRSIVLQAFSVCCKNYRNVIHRARVRYLNYFWNTNGVSSDLIGCRTRVPFALHDREGDVVHLRETNVCYVREGGVDTLMI